MIELPAAQLPVRSALERSWRVLVVVLAVVGCGVTPRWVSREAPSWGVVGLFVAWTAVCLAGELRSGSARIGTAPNLVMTRSGPVRIAASLMLPVAGMIAFAVVITMVDLRGQVVWWRRAHTCSAGLLAMLASALVWHAVLGPELVEPLTARNARAFAIATVLASVVHFAVASAVVLGPAAIADGGWSLLLADRDNLSFDGGEVLLGATFVTLTHLSWWLAGIVVLLLLLTGRAQGYRRSQLAARTDAKTGLLNMVRFRELAERELRRAAPGSTTLLMVDIDHLRRLNKDLGHLGGDEAIAVVATAIRTHLRARDLAARFGGEEFAVLLSSVTELEAVGIAERIRASVAEGVLPGSGAPAATVSVGVAVRRSGDDLESLVQRADAALYSAKDGGRNRVHYATRSSTDPRDQGAVT